MPECTGRIGANLARNGASSWWPTPGPAIPSPRISPTTASTQVMPIVDVYELIDTVRKEAVSGSIASAAG